MDSYDTPARDYFPGMGEAVADRTVNRVIEAEIERPYYDNYDLPRRDDEALDDEVEKEAQARKQVIADYEVTYGDGEVVEVAVTVTGERRRENWGEVAERVARGSTTLAGNDLQDFHGLQHHLRQASVLMSGRHLQHGDETQAERNMELFTNCASSAFNFIEFYLLLNGSGVGRSYDDDLMITDWSKAPLCVPVIDVFHSDVLNGDVKGYMDARTARHLYTDHNIVEFKVPDSREGWAAAVEKLETMTWKGTHADDVLLLDFSDVREKGAPIGGMQDRPASGPGPLMDSLRLVSSVTMARMDRWRQAMFVDHLLAECVLVGGARRAARMATKTWRDSTVLDFIQVKRGGFLWSANNSVTVDAEFWERVRSDDTDEMTLWAKKVLEAATKAAYYDNTGEPGFINVDRLHQNDEGMEIYEDGEFAGSSRYRLTDAAKAMGKDLLSVLKGKPFKMTTNPCGEITLLITGGYCVIADVVPFHAGALANDQDDWDDDAEDAFVNATRALIRTNTMDSLYHREVSRTNRIGVGLTGLHEYAWARFGYGFRDLIDEEGSKDFWLTLSRFKRAINREAKAYSEELGMGLPHTTTTIKPAGCRPWYALTTTKEGVLTLQELFENHPENQQWGDSIEGEFEAIQDNGETRPLTRTFDNGEAEVKQIRMAYGLTVESTGNHPWFVKERVSPTNKGKRVPHNDWVATDDIHPGDVLDVSVGVYDKREHRPLEPLSMFAVRMRGKNEVITQPTHMNPDLAWLLGYLWGDGAMSPQKFRLRWLDRNVENLEKANRVFREQFGIEGIIRKDPDKDASNLEIANAELWHWMIKNGVFKYHADNIDLIPRVVRESAQEDILAFIAGLIDADGAIARSKTDKSVIFSQADYRFSRHVQDVAWTVGIAFGMSHNTCGENWQQGRKSMHLLTMSVATCHEALSMMIPHSNKMVSANTEENDWRCNKSEHRRRTLGKVESVESIGVMPTYDVEVADNNWFYAGAVKSHNTTSKLFGLTEGAHLPAMREYIRWVQFRKGDPLVDQYREQGYPTRELHHYAGHVIVGFPTRHTICEMGMGDKLVTADEATPEEQYQWLRLLEKYWIRGVEEDGVTPLPETGNQVSYTLKYDPALVSYEDFVRTVVDGQSTVRCCAVMPTVDTSAYEYQPEEAVTKAEYERIANGIFASGETREDVAFEHIDCGSGGCPVDFDESI